MSTSTIKQTRFSLHLLEPGEIYFEDYLVNYHLNNSPLTQTNEVQKGHLKVCSKSLVFEPLDTSQPLVKYSFKSIESIKDFQDELDFNTKIKNYFFSIKCKQIIQLKAFNKITPYKTIRCQKDSENQFYFQFLFTNVNDSLALINQLYRANTLDYDQESMMINLIVNSRLKHVKFDLTQLEDIYNELIKYECEVFKINALVKNPGKILLTNKCIYFKAFNNLDGEKIFKIRLNDIKAFNKRRYQLKRSSACEIIASNSEIYLAFESDVKCTQFYDCLKEQIGFDNGQQEQENMLYKWRCGSLSNYDYLMYLNSIADRSFNDLTQYPVLPWVLVDYKSSKIDLNDENIYRDLSKPIGALNPIRLERLKQRFIEINDTLKLNEESRFLYGSHYSTPAFVLFYLVRQYPEWQLCLQSGRFDQPDRLFHSIADTWNNCFNIDSDVKELIPQFYDINDPICGEFLLNKQKIDFGMRHDLSKIDDIILPPWCNNDPKLFVQILREALESQYVSENLHKWIDLIFGYKQRGQEAIEADNLFYYLCYEGAVDLDKIKDLNERKSIEIQIEEFGQIPIQLFHQSHPKRARPIDASLNELRRLSIVDKTLEQDINPQSDSLTTIKRTMSFDNPTKDFDVLLHKKGINDITHVLLDNHSLPFICTVSSDNWLKIYSYEDRSIHRSHNINDFNLSSCDYIQIITSNGTRHTLLLLSCWDNSINIYDLNFSRCIYIQEDAHYDAVTRLRVFGDREKCKDGSFYIFSSSWDSTIKIWHLDFNVDQNSIKFKLKHELTHDSSILDFDLCDSYLTSCSDGSLSVWMFSDSNDPLSANIVHSILKSSGDITDCKLLVEKDSKLTLAAYCTSDSFIKIVNLQNYSEIFSLKISNLEANVELKLNKLLYTNECIITCDSNGFVYFIDLEQKSADASSSSGFLRSTFKLSNSNLTCLRMILPNQICVGDTDGRLHFISFNA